MCSYPCNWQERTFYNEEADLDVFIPNAYQLKLNIVPEPVIECLIREGPFIVNRRGVNKDDYRYRCLKINDVCDDSFVVIETPLFKQDFPPNLCDICTPGNLTSKPQVWVDLGCDVPKNCPVQHRTDIQCNGCEKNQPNDDIACSTCKKRKEKSGNIKGNIPERRRNQPMVHIPERRRNQPMVHFLEALTGAKHKRKNMLNHCHVSIEKANY
ncbi:unnamed protein product [Mytilus edulis]|uniref:Uncharacterized protein n=1 Tax=Mytilus edulis TaxID=6550 RepID=A0A8S3RM09_MYTED|nr:unnamed protein product [Mytilus edulis]